MPCIASPDPALLKYVTCVSREEPTLIWVEITYPSFLPFFLVCAILSLSQIKTQAVDHPQAWGPSFFPQVTDGVSGTYGFF